MNIWHTDFLNIFNEKLYSKVLTEDNIITDEVAKTYNEQSFFGFVLSQETGRSKVKQKYFLKTDFIDHLPIRVTNKDKFSYKGEVLWFIKGANSIQIPAEKRMFFRELVDTFADYKHSQPLHWKLFRIICLAGYIERLNIRVVSEASFGKDGVVDILGLLNGGVSNLYKATLAKLKYSLRNQFIVINELGALDSQEASDMQTYLLQAGAYKPRYENNSRSTAGTKEIVDLTDKTHLVMHNTPDYYVQKGQKYFEELFTKAVQDRFPALLLTGWVEEDFTQSPSFDDVTEETMTTIKNVIATVNYFKAHPVTKHKYTFPSEEFDFRGKERQRAQRSFKIICKYLGEYSDSEAEYRQWVEILKHSWKEYQRLSREVWNGLN